ncbi:MAG: VWA domain-containing protein [Acidobacteria bacterium]|nr:MAG: VWA domain-containing protein [Acidobacteriota bacterium]
MRGHQLVAACVALFLFVGFNPKVHSQESAPPPPAPGSASVSDVNNDTVFRVNVDMVQLNVAVIDRKGNYVTGLRPSDFEIIEDTTPQKMATFEEGNQDPIMLLNPSQPTTNPSAASVADSRIGSGSPQFSSAGANVFILFDTSNYMYRGFVFAQDAISDFVRTLDATAKIAFYSYSRDVARDALLTSDRSQVLRGVRSTVAGADAALYNALLLVLRDAGQYTGRKVIVVFSNGPDNASMVPPEGVGELAQSEGIPIYMISTREAKQDPMSTAVFERMSASTGGQAYFAKNWKEQEQAFASVRDDLSHLYALSYYPQPNPNRGWRTITVKLIGEKLKAFRIRTRNGYRPRPTGFTPDTPADTALAR